MHPHEEWRLLLLIQPGDGVRNYISCPPLQSVVAALVDASLGAKASIEEIKPTIKSGSHIRLRIEDQRSDKRRRVIPRLLQNLRHRRQQRRQRMAKIGNCMELWISPGENRGVRNRRQRRLGESLLKHHALPRQSVKIRRNSAFATKKTHAVSAGGIHGDKDDIGSFSPGVGTGVQPEEEKKRENTSHGK